MSNTDIKIWERILSGDTVAWEELVMRYARLVFSVAKHSGLSKAEAEDCSQQVWMALYNGRLRIKKPDQLYSWLISTTQRRSWRIIERRDRAREAHQNLPSRPPVIGPDVELDEIMQRARLEEALRRLGGRCEKLLRAIFFGPKQMSYKEISRELGIPFNSLGPTRARCLRKLRQIIEEMEGG